MLDDIVRSSAVGVLDGHGESFLFGVFEAVALVQTALPVCEFQFVAAETGLVFVAGFVFVL